MIIVIATTVIFLLSTDLERQIQKNELNLFKTLQKRQVQRAQNHILRDPGRPFS